MGWIIRLKPRLFIAQSGQFSAVRFEIVALLLETIETLPVLLVKTQQSLKFTDVLENPAITAREKLFAQCSEIVQLSIVLAVNRSQRKNASEDGSGLLLDIVH